MLGAYLPLSSLQWPKAEQIGALRVGRFQRGEREAKIRAKVGLYLKDYPS